MIANCQLPIANFPVRPEVFEFGNWQSAIGNDLGSLKVKLRLRWLAVVCQRAFLADCVRALEDPVLPRCQAAVNFCVHRFRTSETKRRFHASQGVGR